MHTATTTTHPRPLSRLSLLAPALALAISALQPFSPSALSSAAAAIPLLPVVAHRGDSYNFPENTLASARGAIAARADGCECDIWITTDNHLVVFHDTVLNRVTDIVPPVDSNGTPVKIPVVTKTLAELKTLDAGRWKDEKFAGERIPTLPEWLAVLKPTATRPVIEIKMENIEPQVIADLRAAGMVDRAVAITFSKTIVQKIRALEPSLVIGWIYSNSKFKGPPRALADLITAGATEAGTPLVDLDDRLVTKELMDLLLARGFTIWVWAVDDPARMKQLYDWGVASITTNRPALLREVHAARAAVNNNAASRRGVACDALSPTKVPQAMPAAAAAAPAQSGLIADGIALFLPAGFPPEKIPASPALLACPRITAPLPAAWKPTLIPQFKVAGASSSRSREQDAPATLPQLQRPIENRKSKIKNTVTIPVSPADSLYGTGESTGPLLRNGQTSLLWNLDNPSYKLNNGLNLYQSHPWVLGVRPDGTAYGIIADTTWRAEIRLGSASTPAATATDATTTTATNNTTPAAPATGAAAPTVNRKPETVNRGGSAAASPAQIEFTSEGPAFPVIIIDRDSPQAVLRALADLTGHMELPPLWALGFQQSRWSYTPDSRVREIAAEFRARKIPCDVLWLDIDYMDGFRDFTFDPKTFPDPKTLNDWLHARGFKSVWMIDPGVKADDPAYPVFLDGNKRDAWVRDAAGAVYTGPVWPGPCVFPDFTRPDVRSWWAGLYRDYMARGLDGVWNDMNEPAVFNVPSKTMPEDNLHLGGPADGDLPALEPNTHARYHNIYGMLETRASRDGLLAANPDKRPFLLTRSTFLGGQRYAATWTGDNASTWKHLRVSIPMTLNLGLSGQPFNGPDIGGFNEKADPDLWGHWISMGAFFPFARAHTRGTINVKTANAKEGQGGGKSKTTAEIIHKEPWAFGPEVETAARLALEARYRLLPYYYTLFRESSLDGMPVMRPVFFADLRDPSLRAEQQVFLVGSDLLVIPRWAKTPALPKGIWREVTLVGEGKGAVENENSGENAAREKSKYQVTLKIRGGAIIPLGKVIQNTTEKSLDPLTLLICLDAQGAATGQLYEDAGEGYAYRDGDYLLTTYRAERDPTTNTVTVTIAAAEGTRPRPVRPIAIELLTPEGPRTATGQDGHPVKITCPPTPPP